MSNGGLFGRGVFVREIQAWQWIAEGAKKVYRDYGASMFFPEKAVEGFKQHGLDAGGQMEKSRRSSACHAD